MIASVSQALVSLAGTLLLWHIHSTWHLQHLLARHFGAPAPANRTSFDFIVVGSGSSGSVVAARLAEGGRHSVLLIEAGGPSHWMQGLQGAWPLFLSDENPYTWSEESGSPRGKALGGTSVLHFGMYVRGRPRDFDGWGIPGWGYREMLRAFKKSEDFKGDPKDAGEVHGTGGPMPVEPCPHRYPIDDLVLKGWQELGYKTGDVNDPAQGEEVFSESAQVMQEGGWREGSYRDFVEPLLGRTKLTVLTYATVSKLIIEGDQVKGVRLERFEESHEYQASKEVILSAGAQGSPKILLLSGIGPKEHLKEYGIPMVKELPVGKNLQNHYSALLTFTTKKSGLMTSPTYNMNPLNYLQALVCGSGPMTTQNGAIAGFFSSQRNNMSDVQFISQSQPLQDLRKGEEGMTLVAVLSRPKTRAELILWSANPEDPPYHSDLQYPVVKEDKETLARALDIMSKLESTEAFKSAGLKIKIHENCRDIHENPYPSHEYWLCHLRMSPNLMVHLAGTCKMGLDNDKGSVVDPRLRVRGLRGLRVADASVAPSLPAGNTHSLCAAVGERAAELLLEDWGDWSPTERRQSRKEEL